MEMTAFIHVAGKMSSNANVIYCGPMPEDEFAASPVCGAREVFASHEIPAESEGPAAYLINYFADFERRAPHTFAAEVEDLKKIAHHVVQSLSRARVEKTEAMVAVDATKRTMAALARWEGAAEIKTAARAALVRAIVEEERVAPGEPPRQESHSVPRSQWEALVRKDDRPTSYPRVSDEILEPYDPPAPPTRNLSFAPPGEARESASPGDDVFSEFLDWYSDKPSSAPQPPPGRRPMAMGRFAR